METLINCPYSERSEGKNKAAEVAVYRRGCVEEYGRKKKNRLMVMYQKTNGHEGGIVRRGVKEH